MLSKVLDRKEWLHLSLELAKVGIILSRRYFVQICDFTHVSVRFLGCSVVFTGLVWVQ